MKVINLWAGPGAGKSTTAAGLFFRMKIEGYKVELVTEYAKDLTYEKQWSVLRDPSLVFAGQRQRLARLRGQVDFAITDSPLLLPIYYSAGKSAEVEQRILEEWALYDNTNIFIGRVKPYQPYGRRESEGAARRVDEGLAMLMDRLELSGIAVRGDEDAPAVILRYLKNKGIA